MRRALLGILLGSSLLAAPASGTASDDCDCDCGTGKIRPAVLRLGAVASSPDTVTVFESLRRHLGRHGLPVDYVLFSNYDALVEALRAGQVHIAWNTPLAHARYHLQSGGESQTLVMRDVDRDARAKLIARNDAGITSVSGLEGKTLVLGSSEAAEATILPTYFLKKEGLDLGKVKVLSLDKELDLRGHPCSSETHVLRALTEGRAQAGVISERLWERLKKDDPDRVGGLVDLWTSPAFSHCVFTASRDLDAGLARRFTELMTAMDPSDPLAAPALRLEGARKWVKGSPEGFEVLFKAMLDSDACCGSSCTAEAASAAGR